MNNMDELFQKAADTVGLENPAENTATAIRDKMQEGISNAIYGAYDKGLSEGKNLAVEHILIVLHTFAENLSNKTDKEIVNLCIKLVEMMKEQ